MHIEVAQICSGLGHWDIAVDGEVLAHTGWDDLQKPLEPEEMKQLAVLLLRVKCAGLSLSDMSDLLANGVTA